MSLKIFLYIFFVYIRKTIKAIYYSHFIDIFYSNCKLSLIYIICNDYKSFTFKSIFY